MSRVLLLSLALCALSSSGVAQPMCTGSSVDLFQTITRSQDLSIFASAIRVAEAVTQFTDPSLAITVFVPIDFAFGNILPPGRGFFDLVPDVAIAQALVNYHSVDRPLPARLFDEDRRLNTALVQNGRQMRLELVEEISSPSGWMVKGALNSANITRTNIIGCNSVVHVIDAVLLPDEDLLPIGTTTIGEAIDTAESFENLLTPLQPGDAERREEARTRLMLTQVSIGTAELLGAPEAEEDVVTTLLADLDDVPGGGRRAGR